MKLGIWAARGGPADEDDISDAFRFSTEIVKRAEELGFATSLFAQRLLGQDLDPLVLAAALATATSRIELMLAMHPGVKPAQMAEKWARRWTASAIVVSRSTSSMAVGKGKSRSVGTASGLIATTTAISAWTNICR